MVNDERGQLILIGALLVAATILGSITLLNTVHESPEIKTQQDSQSLADTDRKITEIKADLDRLFYHNVSVSETGEPLPYTNDSFGGIVGEYERQNLNLSTVTTASIVNVTYLESESLQGGIFKQNTSDDGYELLPGDSVPSPGVTVLDDAETIPVFTVEVNQTESSGEFLITLSEGSDSVDIRVTASEVEVDNGVSTKVCDRADRNDLVTIEFVNGTGSIENETGAEYCGGLDFEDRLDPGIDVTFDNNNQANGTVVLTGTGSSLSSPGAPYGEQYREYRDTDSQGNPITVNPKFVVEYKTPNVAYNSTFSLYNTTGR